MRERNHLEEALEAYYTVSSSYEDDLLLLHMAEDEKDEETIKAITQSLKSLAAICAKKKVECLFSGEADANDCFIEIHAGAGGTESQDWAEMLERMYLRWAENHQFKTLIMDRLYGDGAGIKSSTIRINGLNAYGWAKSESGVHRLVRISPFDSNARRHTSFASIWVYPVVDDSIEIDINESDLRIDTYRSSGAGGQHVNTTDSAIRITHLPSGVVVQCQTDRSQHRNKAEAMNMLRARLYELELQRKQGEKNASEAAKTEIGWGHQIRSYVLHPYQMVKDLRTGYQTSETARVLDGELDEIITTTLTAIASGESGEAVSDID
jgi:peptide chain release factor 2